MFRQFQFIFRKNYSMQYLRNEKQYIEAKKIASVLFLKDFRSLKITKKFISFGKKKIKLEKVYIFC